MLVFVLSKEGKALMPCSSRKARLLLKEGKAKVMRRTPFTIKLLFGSSGYKQDTTLGIDTGSSVIGSAVVSDGIWLDGTWLDKKNPQPEKAEQ